ncbi:subtilase family protein [Hirsutella rhossiliensis]|uniref:Subtilase family domain-containing protein n=1 Tax=Hirsutella rhossiliensis TaxID=111463 RepID=A0A9P8SI34_9HYPO|nr:subtilase family domain-containing protein [Hirsutella rhossiliensis]KAH0962195.1 subtilase family domain-containing protein [Hirsutella rhossiliensis]
MAPSLSSLLLALLPLVSGLPDPSPATVNVSNPNSTTKMDGSWIVVWKQEADDKTIAARQAEFSATLRKRSLSKRDGAPMKSTDHAIGDFRATSCDTDAKTMNLMISEAADQVEFVEANQRITMFQTEEKEAKPPNVNLTALQEASARDKGPKGAGTVVYIMDTGVNVNHTVFGGRAEMVGNFVANEPNQDLNGHGTHCAGSAAGLGTGVAPEALIRGVKILNQAGAGGGNSILDGFEAACKDVKNNRFQGKCVVSMSLGTEESDAINRAAVQMTKCGCAVVVAAGNEDRDASAVSPASSRGVITVGATDVRTNKLAAFTNRGPDVDISVNGVNVISSDAKNETGLKDLTGTSMSAPQVAGKALEVLSTGKIKCSTDCTDVVREALQNQARQEKPITEEPGALKTTPLQLNTTGEVPVDFKGPTAIGAGGRKGGASQGGNGLGEESAGKVRKGDKGDKGGAA